MPKYSWTPPAGSAARLSVANSETCSVFAPIVERLLEIARGDDAKSQVPEASGDLQGAGAGHECLVQLVERGMDGRHESVDLATPAIVFQPLGKGLGLAEMIEHLPAFTELAQHPPQLEANIEGLLQRGPALRQCLQNAQRLLEPGPGVRQRRSRGRLASGLPEIVHCLLTLLAPHGMMGEPLDLFAKPVGIELFYRSPRHARGCRAGVREAPRCRRRHE